MPNPLARAMDLKSGYPFWAIRNGLLHAFPPLDRDRRCDVAVIGAGITGALIADELARHGHEVVVVDQRDAGWGSTCASTALIQYEIDAHMTELAEAYGERNAAMAYLACVDAVAQLGELAKAVRDVDYRPMRSLYMASRALHVRRLRREFEMRARCGIEVDWLDSQALQERAGIPGPAAILSAHAACIDPYRLTYRLLMRLERQGVSIHDRTRVERIESHPRSVELVTTHGMRIRCACVVVAAGYESQRFLPNPRVRNRSSYAVVTEPVPLEALGILQDTLLWETARPYLYVRTTGDRRVIVGGEDDGVDLPRRRDKRVAGKAGKLLKRLEGLFPALETHLQPAFCWAGTFAETRDGLPYFGVARDTGSRVIHAMAYGGNGMVYSMLGRTLVRSIIERKAHPLQRLFGFAR